MDFDEALVLSQIVSTVLFFGLFIIFTVWAYRPGGRRVYEDAARIPFDAAEEK
ncbi:cbb3-type cytochrome oxidase subunit 3 [Zavarzinia sp.]|uniref:cbb3-type cytochrome oxidase subunit 3 n=1 Tax=Zavarzinia sp. TaxID=2027920 RepID=UPI003569F16F